MNESSVELQQTAGRKTDGKAELRQTQLRLDFSED